MATIHYVNASLLHDVIMGISFTDILSIINNAPPNWFLKEQRQSLMGHNIWQPENIQNKVGI